MNGMNWVEIKWVKINKTLYMSEQSKMEGMVKYHI